FCNAVLPRRSLLPSGHARLVLQAACATEESIMHLRTALLSAGLLVLPGCMGGLTPGQVAPADIPDPTTVKRTGVPNDWLICPADTCAATASSVAPTYPIPPATMFQAWRSVLAAQPRVTVIAEDEPRLLI